MALARPGKFRWQTASPTAQLIVTDGAKLWLYDEDLRQVTIRSASEALQGTPAALLSQKKALTDAFTVEDEGQDEGARRLKLLPKSKESDFQDVTLWLKGAAPVRMQFRDTLGGATDIRFAKAETNGKLDAALFRFTPPKGVEVIDAETEATR
jgi:outer membrane lipoprotein carrier protein